MRIFGILGVLLRYFRGILGLNSGSPEIRAGGYFFDIFRGNSGSGHSGLCSRSGRSQHYGFECCSTQRAQRSKKIRDFDRDWKFRARMKFSSEPPTRGPIFCGEIETSRLKFSSEIKNFDREWKFRSGSNFFDRWALWVFWVSEFSTEGSFGKGPNPFALPDGALLPSSLSAGNSLINLVRRRLVD